MKKSNIILKLVGLLFTSIICGVLLLMVVYSLPTDRIRNNLNDSIPLYKQDSYKIENWIGNLRYAKLDNTTDAVMFNTALCRENDTLLENVLLNPHYVGTEQAIENLNSSDLEMFLVDENIKGINNYSRYWHGYLVYMIPLLNIFNVGNLRVVFMGLEFLLMFYLCFKIVNIKPIYSLAYLATFVFISPITTMLNFQNSTILLISIISSILILEFNDWFSNNNRFYLLFAFIGICTAYFDFLTYPIVTYGMPLITYLLANKKNLIESVKEVVLFGLCWIFGYGGMWFSKWLVATALTNSNVIGDAINSTMLRTGINDNYSEDLSFRFAMVNAWASFKDAPMTFLFILAMVIIIIYALINKNKPVINKDYLIDVLPFIVVGLSSYVWAFVARNHFVTHQFLEYRTLAVMVLSKFIVIIKIFDNQSHSVR